jgi:hypothetical protein
MMVLLCVAIFAGAVKENMEGRDGPFAIACALCATFICLIAFGFTVILS